MILGFKAIERASFAFHVTLGTGVRLDLRRDMIKDSPFMLILF